MSKTKEEALADAKDKLRKLLALSGKKTFNVDEVTQVVEAAVIVTVENMQAEAVKAPPGLWRTGRSVGRTVYLDDKLVGMFDTPLLADCAVAALNQPDCPIPVAGKEGPPLRNYIVALAGTLDAKFNVDSTDAEVLRACHAKARRVMGLLKEAQKAVDWLHSEE